MDPWLYGPAGMDVNCSSSTPPSTIQSPSTAIRLLGSTIIILHYFLMLRAIKEAKEEELCGGVQWQLLRLISEEINRQSRRHAFVVDGSWGMVRARFLWAEDRLI